MGGHLFSETILFAEEIDLQELTVNHWREYTTTQQGLCYGKQRAEVIDVK
jgi:hypothetical protein